MKLDGTEVKYFRKQYTNDVLDMIMGEFAEQERRRDEAEAARLAAEALAEQAEALAAGEE
ncbi:hypothetical protein D3C86_1817310 [compost metagenome]